MLKKQASAPAAPLSAEFANPRRRLQTRRSGVHGKGVFALQDLAEGETLIEYAGEVISWPEALRRHPHDPANPNHTFYFHIDEDRVIDGKHGGNSSRWINHSCEPNCEAEDQDGRIFIKALRNIQAGEELFFDYGLIIDDEHTPELLADYPCWCGAPSCRGTLLAPREEAQEEVAAEPEPVEPAPVEPAPKKAAGNNKKAAEKSARTSAGKKPAPSRKR